MLALVLSILTTAATSFANVGGYGLGQLGALDCPTPFAPANGAISDEDPMLNSRGLVTQARGQLELVNRALAEQAQFIARERAGLTSALGPQAFNALDVHFRFGRGPQSYRAECSAPAIAPALPANATLEPPPPGFCVNVGGRVRNYWLDHFAGPQGRVNESICNLRVGFGGPRPPAQVGPCVAHLRGYYAAQARQAALQAKLAAINAEILSYETNANAIRAQTSESNFCIACERARLQSLEAENGGAVGNGMSPLMQLLQFVLNGGRRPVRYGGNPMQYPGRPYIVRVPHYYSTFGGQYGGAPGGVGRGAFAGCGGPAGLGLGSNFAPPVQPFMNQRATGPFDAAYGDPMFDPGLQNGLFNRGYGPTGTGPQIGRGLIAPAIAGAAFGGQRPQFGFQQPQPVANYVNQPYLYNPNQQFGFGNVGTGLVNRPVFNGAPPPVIGTGQTVNPSYSLGALPSRQYAGGALFPPVIAGPALASQQAVNTIPASTQFQPPAYIR